MVNEFIKDKVADALNDGFYRVKKDGQFIEAAPTARELFGIPIDEKDISKYSIQDLYASPEDRQERLKNLRNADEKPVIDILSLRVKGENKLLFSLCWYDINDLGDIFISGLVANIENRIIFPKMFDDLPIGIYEVDNDNKIVRFNKKALEIFGYKESDQLAGKNIADFYVDTNDLEEFSRKVSKDGFAQDVLRLQNVDKKIIGVKCFSKKIKESDRARWGFILDVTQRERYYQALDRMPTGYYYIEYYGGKNRRHHGRVVECNEQFARILGVSKDEVIGKNITDLYYSMDEGDEYFRLLDEKDKNRKPVLNYPFRLKRISDGTIVHITVDSHLIKEKGKLIGREGTIRDITREVQLREQVEEANARLERATTDINNLIHTFLHPVIKFAGNSELMHQMGNVLFQTSHPEKYSKEDLDKTGDAKKLGQTLMEYLISVRNSLSDVDTNTDDIAEGEIPVRLKLENIKNRLTQIINVFHHSLQSEVSDILLDGAVRDTALWVLEELNNVRHFEFEELNTPAMKNFIEFLQGILFIYIIRGARILVGETEIMKRGVEALRQYIGKKKARKYGFKKHDVSKILETLLELFKPVLLEKRIEIDYKKTGNLLAEISVNDIDRVICNLLHNVRKYSHGGFGRTGRFTKVRARENQPGNEVIFFIESYGIPIMKEEIESGRIWEFGYRGESAYVSDRDGTGVGLADAKDVIEAHGGKISITSKPASDKLASKDGDPPQYKVPYLTRVTIKIPKIRREIGGKNGNQ